MILLGSALWVAEVAGFSLAGLGLLGVPRLRAIWQGTAVFGSATSLILLGLYWHTRLVMGVVIIQPAVFISIWQHCCTALYK